MIISNFSLFWHGRNNRMYWWRDGRQRTAAEGIEEDVDVVSALELFDAGTGRRGGRFNDATPQSNKSIGRDVHLQRHHRVVLLVQTHVPLVRSPGELALGHAEGQHHPRSLGHLRTGSCQHRAMSLRGPPCFIRLRVS